METGYCLRSSATILFVSQLIRDNTKENIKGSHQWPFVRGTHRVPVDSPHKGPVMWRSYPCHDVRHHAPHKKLKAGLTPWHVYGFCIGSTADLWGRPSTRHVTTSGGHGTHIVTAVAVATTLKQNTSHITFYLQNYLPSQARYGVSLVNPCSSFLPVLVITVLYAIHRCMLDHTNPLSRPP